MRASGEAWVSRYFELPGRGLCGNHRVVASGKGILVPENFPVVLGEGGSLQGSQVVLVNIDSGVEVLDEESFRRVIH